jgi:hypothetical protein
MELDRASMKYEKGKSGLLRGLKSTMHLKIKVK